MKWLVFCLVLLLTACRREPVTVADNGPAWPSRLRCELRREQADEFEGTCVSPEAPPRAIRLTSLGTSEAFEWQGTWWESGGAPIGSPERLSKLIGVARSVIAVSPPSVDLYRAGLVESYWGAYSLDSFVESDESLTFTYSHGPESYVRPTPVDLLILERTKGILSSESVWDRADDRACDDQSETWSLYCALFLATYEVIGSSHHYQPAMDGVREVIVNSYLDRLHGHALMDFNNDAMTTLDEIHGVIERAEEHLRGQLGE